MVTRCDPGGSPISEDIEKIFNKQPDAPWSLAVYLSEQNSCTELRKHDFRPLMNVTCFTF